MGEIVNLNKFRKARDKQEAAARTAENRTRFGQSKTQRSKIRKETDKAAGDLDNKQLD
ncbi:MAG: hypothetical protein QOJ54_3490 [Aliidongia sp.]|jgi:hypothetical protein|nr:hypothetical protein [Aliidongia sp.]